MERFERKITIVDITMVTLALLSVGILVYLEFWKPEDPLRTRLLYLDLAVVAVFVIEFLFRVAESDKKWSYVGRHWYDILGMVPALAFSHPIFRAFRLVRVIRIAAIAGRFIRVTDRTFGEAFVHRTLGRYKAAFVEELTTPIALAVLGAAENAVLKGNYGTTIANALRKERDDIVTHVVAQLRKDGPVALLMRTPGIGSAIEHLPGRVLDGVIETLDAKAMDESIRDILRDILAGLKRDIGRRDWRQDAA